MLSNHFADLENHYHWYNIATSAAKRYKTLQKTVFAWIAFAYSSNRAKVFIWTFTPCRLPLSSIYISLFVHLKDCAICKMRQNIQAD